MRILDYVKHLSDASDVDQKCDSADCMSYDSGVCCDDASESSDGVKMQLKNILYILERDADMRRLQREHLGKIVERTPSKKSTTNCNVCCSELNVEDIKCCTTCCVCSKYMCRGDDCSSWVPKEAGWECYLCSTTSESRAKAKDWIDAHVALNNNNEKLPASVLGRSGMYSPIRNGRIRSPGLFSYETQSDTTSSLSTDKKNKIREYVEDILGNMLGGSLDSTSVAQLSKSESYQNLFHKYHSNLSQNLFMLENRIRQSTADLPLVGNENDFAGVSTQKLKRLIEKIIEETLRLPSVLDSKTAANPAVENGNALTGGDDSELNYFEHKRYQELLATAVLNKIAQTNETPKYSALEADLDSNHNSLVRGKSGSSLGDSPQLELYSNSNVLTNALDEDFEGDRESVISDYLATHRVPLPNISPEEAEEDDSSCTPVNGSEGTWEDNWLFKKRKPGQEMSSVGMLVPAPKEDIRALIGDQAADEVSDFSDAGSDIEESVELEDAYVDPPNHRVLNQNLIGGKNTAGLIDELIEQTSLMSTTSLAENEPVYTDTKNLFILSEGNSDVDGNSPVTGDIAQNGLLEKSPSDQILPPPSSFTDGTDDESESFATPAASSSDYGTDHLSSDTNSNCTDESTSTVIDALEVSLSDSLGDSSESSNLVGDSTNQTTNNNTTNDLNNICTNSNDYVSASEPQSGDEDTEVVMKHFVPGSIAEREYKKWYNAVDMPNNPYSPEALKRRLSTGHEKYIDLPNISPTTEEKITVVHCAPSLDNEQEEDCTRRYSRDYYINDAKHASGSQRNSSSSHVDQEHSEETQSPLPADTFSARPVVIDDGADDVQEAQRDFQLTPSDDLPQLHQKAQSEHNLSLNQDSLTASEDSDIMRIYDLTKQETTMLKEKFASTSQINSIKARPSVLPLTTSKSTTLRSVTQVKAVTPINLKFLQPKRKLLDPEFEAALLQTPIAPEKKVIEDEVAGSLPSVKALAQAYQTTSTQVTRTESFKSQTRPKSFNKSLTIDSPVLPPTPFPTPDDSQPTFEELSMKFSSKAEESISYSITHSSPVLTPGKLQNNIAFFENLKNK